MAIPAVKLVPVPANSWCGAFAPVPATQSHGAKESPQSPPALADLRWSRVEEFFRSRELRPNTHKSYEREFKAFLGWTEKGWQDITARDLDRYKDYLKALPSGRGGKRSPRRQAHAPPSRDTAGAYGCYGDLGFCNSCGAYGKVHPPSSPFPLAHEERSHLQQRAWHRDGIFQIEISA